MIRKLFALVIITLVSCHEKTVQLPGHVETYYGERHRPLFHFSPEANWMNDPNGMVYYEGEYHLFYQYYPDSTVWGPMHWGHAVSEDMVHWEHLPIALYPDSLGYIFSGSAVIDWDNTSGLGLSEEPPMIAIFTHHNASMERSDTSDTYQYQSIAYSNDKGRTFTKYEGNPVVPNPGIRDFRDPKVIWHEESQRWIMVLSAFDRVQFYHSPDLKEWTYTSSFGISGDQRLWECPDLFQMEVEGSKETKWILITSIQKEGPNGGTATSYFVGDFDGGTFSADNNRQQWLDYGTDNYAMVTWSDIPEKDGRRLALGWMSNWQYAQSVPTERWRSAMTLPRSLTLYQSTDDDYHIRSNPVSELSTIEGRSRVISGKIYTADEVILEDTTHHLYKLDLRFNKPRGGVIELRYSNSKGEHISFGYDASHQGYFIDRTSSGHSDFSEVFAARHVGAANYNLDKVEMTVFLDQSSIELFADGGRCVMTDIFFPTEPFSKMEVVVRDNYVQLEIGSISRLKSTWQ